MCQLKKDIEQGRIYKRRGSGGSTPTPPPPPSIFRFSLKSEGKEVEKKEKE